MKEYYLNLINEVLENNCKVIVTEDIDGKHEIIDVVFCTNKTFKDNEIIYYGEIIVFYDFVCEDGICLHSRKNTNKITSMYSMTNEGYSMGLECTEKINSDIFQKLIKIINRELIKN